MMKPLPLEAVWVCWPKILVLVAEQLMDTLLFTTEAYTSAGSIFVWPSTFFTCTDTGWRSLCWRTAFSVPLLLAMAAPPQPARPPATAQARISAVTLTAVRRKKPCFFTGSGSGAAVRRGSGA